MSSDDDSDTFERFLAEQKMKVNKRYMTMKELENLDTMDHFIVDNESDNADSSDSESIEESGEECDSEEDSNKSNSKEPKIKEETTKVKLRKTACSPLFSDLSDSASDDKEEIKVVCRKRLQIDDDSHSIIKVEAKKKTAFNDFAYKSRARDSDSSLFSDGSLSEISFLSDTGHSFVTPKKKPISTMDLLTSCDRTCAKAKPRVPLVTPVHRLPRMVAKTVLTKPGKYRPIREVSDSDSDEYDCSFIDDGKSAIQSECDGEESSDVVTDSEEGSESALDVHHILEHTAMHTPAQTGKIRQYHVPQTAPTKRPLKKLDFISSLLDKIDDMERDADALKYRKNYKTLKEELAIKIYQIYNGKVFLNKLPQDIEIKWYPRLRKTAGRCMMSYDKENHLERLIRIQLSTKVLTDAERLLKTLVHEMCHGAVWMINKKDDHHGPIWKTWTYEAQKQFPALPISTRCHSYQIKYKYEYWCLACNTAVKRHSKSLDTTKKICGKCRGKFTLFCNQSNGDKKLLNENEQKQGLAGFSKFVKDNYKKYRSTGISHCEVMQILSGKYKLYKEEEEANLSKMVATMNLVEGD